ncbi:MAG TPA: phage tail protein, partial [bacterium]|nr:phage tail protein [bacterium]
GEGIHESRINVRSFEDAEGRAMEFCQVGQGINAFFEYRNRADVLMDSLEDSSTYVQEIETSCGMRLSEFDGQLYLMARRPARRILCTITDSKIERGKLTYSYAGMTERPGNAVRVEFMNRTNETAMNLPWRIDVVEVVYLQDAESVRGTKVIRTVRSRVIIDRSVAYRLGEQTLLASMFERLRVMFPTTGELLLAAPGDHFYLTTDLIPDCTKKVFRIEEITEDNDRNLQVVAVEQCDDAYRLHIYQQDPTDQRESVLGDYGIYLDSAAGLTDTFVPWPARAIAIDRPNEKRGVVQFLYSRGEYDRHLVDIAIHTSDGRDASSFAVFAASAHLHESISDSDTTIQISMASLLDDGTRGETFKEGEGGTIWIASYADAGGVRIMGALEAVSYTNFEIVTVGGEEIGQFTGCKRGALNTSPAEHSIVTVNQPMHMVEDPVREAWDVNFPKPYVLGYGDKRTGVNDASYVYFGANAKFNEIVFSNLVRSNPEYRIYVNEMEYGASEDSVVWEKAVGLCDETDDFMNLNGTQQRRIITFEAGMDWKVSDVNDYNRYWVRFEKTVTVPHTRHGYGFDQIPQEMDQAITLRLCPVVYKHVPWPTSYEYPREDQRQDLQFEVAGIARWSQASASTQNPIILIDIGTEFGDRGMYSGDMDLDESSPELKKGDGVYLGTDGKAYKLDPTSPVDVKAWLGFATENVQPGAKIAGKVDVDGTAYNNSWAMTAGAEVYVDFANKTLTQTRPTGQYTVAGIATQSNELQMTINGDMGREWLLLRWHKELLTSDDDDPATPHYPLSHKARQNPIMIFVGGANQSEGSGDPASLDSTIYGFVPDADRRGIKLTWKPDPGTGVVAVYLIEEE